MNRTVYYDAVILTIKTFGEGHRDILALTAEKGLIHATLYGGAKSKLRSLVSPYHQGTLYLYYEPAKDSYKITDFDAKTFRVSLRENIVKTYVAALATEFLIATLASGNTTKEAFIFYNGLLEGLSLSDEEGSKYGLLRFIWRYLNILGIKPDYSTCMICGEHNTEELWFSCDTGTFICEKCLTGFQETNNHNLIRVSKIIQDYFFVIENGKMSESRKIRLPKEFYDSVKNIIFVLMKKASPKPLKALEIAQGIF